MGYMELFHVPFIFTIMDEKHKLILNLVNCVLGSWIKIREIHWNTTNQAKHNLTNTIMYEISDHMDAMIEIMSGFCERPGYGILKPVIPATNDLKSILKALSIKTESYQELLEDPMYRGMNNRLDQLSEDLNKWSYLSDNF